MKRIRAIKLMAVLLMLTTLAPRSEAQTAPPTDSNAAPGRVGGDTAGSPSGMGSQTSDTRVPDPPAKIGAGGGNGRVPATSTRRTKQPPRREPAKRRTDDDSGEPK